MFKKTKIFCICFPFFLHFFFLRREYDRKKGLSPNTAPAISREQNFLEFAAGCSLFSGPGQCVRVAYTVTLYILRTCQRQGCQVGFSDPEAMCYTHFMLFSNRHSCCASSSNFVRKTFSVCKWHPYFYSCSKQASANSNSS